MSAPDRIWVKKSIAEDGNHGSTAWPNTDEPSDIEYIRADLPPTDEQVMAHPKVKALVESLEYAIDYVEGCKVNGLPDLGAASRLPFMDDVLRIGDAALRDLKGGK